MDDCFSSIGKGDKSTKAKKVRFYFHFRSPYSWIGARWLAEFKKRQPLDIEYIPFWEPDEITIALLTRKGGAHYYTPMSTAKHLYILQDIKRITRKLGFPLKWPVDGEKPWWELPHLGYIYARRMGKEPEFFERILRVRWEEGRNICDRETIKQIAETVGLSPNETVNATEDNSIRNEGVDELYKAYEDGVFGIPFFVHGYNKFWGIDRFKDFIASLNEEVGYIEAASENETLNLSTYQIYDIDHAGGCG